MKRTLLVALSLGCSNSVAGGAQGYARGYDAAADAPSTPDLVVNEVAPQGRPDDWFEIYNGTATGLSLGNYAYSDSLERSPVSFAENAIVEPGDYYVEFLDEEHPGFGLGSDEGVFLFVGDELVDSLVWTEADALEEASWARIPDATGEPRLTLRSTPGTPNVELSE